MGAGVAGESLAGGDLARRQQGSVAFPLCRPAGSTGVRRRTPRELPAGVGEPSGYWLALLPAKLSLKRLVGICKQRWVIERDYEELKGELGLGHYEGRNWRGFHHHGTLCIAAYGFLMAERSRFSPSAHVGHLGLRDARIPPDFQPRGAKGSRATA